MSDTLRWFVPIVLLVLITMTKAYQQPDRRFTGGRKQYCDADLRTMLALTCEINMRKKREIASRALPPRYKHMSDLQRMKRESMEMIEQANQACCRKPCSLQEMVHFCPKSNIDPNLFFNINYQDY